ncbi:hypothetical protein [Streptomyces microflavus]|uniref:hypothetical protein n=1 Tax=Streptomyces microflavus TaxID=1919 RepID=UPI00364B11F7
MNAPEEWDCEHDTIGSLTLPPPLPEKPALPTGLAITRRSAFTVTANDRASDQACNIARSVLALMIGSDDAAERTVRQVLMCFGELVSLASTRTDGTDMLCEVWMDSHHLFVCVEHDERSPAGTDPALTFVKAIADDHGTHIAGTTHQTWAAIRRA